jgi:type VI secretion system lysozyme-like protein
MTFFDKFDSKSRRRVADRYLNSIVENLNNVLNTKKEFGSILIDMGIRDLNEFRSRDDILSVVMEEVRHNIEQYEPRVELVDIIPQPTKSMFVLSFKIECIVRKNAQSLEMVFDTFFSKFHVKNFVD